MTERIDKVNYYLEIADTVLKRVRSFNKLLESGD